ncbi:MAG TPA: hypothetical protein VG052_10500 [Puia sp.]|jgi:hypothetical protein|nr:hypothetical protein [Puia sp.]
MRTFFSARQHHNPVFLYFYRNQPMTRRTDLLLYIALAFSFEIAAGQNNIVQKGPGSLDVSIEIQSRVIVSLDSFLNRIEQQRIDSNDVTGADAQLSLSMFSSMKYRIWGADSDRFQIAQPAILKLYPLQDSVYYCSLAFLTDCHVREILTILIRFNAGRTAFAIPLSYFTRTWKRERVGLTTYHYADRINLNRATLFDRKNHLMAMKLGLTPERFDFYLCDNHQDILNLLGYSYDSASAGDLDEGYGVDEGTIFSIRHNEDFSHDLFHYYSAKFRHNKRNSAADEGVAYSWGNPYYTDKQGAIISRHQLVAQLKVYLEHHPEVSLLTLFEKNPMIFPSKARVRSLLSSLICDDIERRAGAKGIKELIDCGPGDENFFRVTGKLAGITPENFNQAIRELINKFDI